MTTDPRSPPAGARVGVAWAAWLGGLALALVLGGGWLVRLTRDPFDADELARLLQPLAALGALALALLGRRALLRWGQPVAVATTVALSTTTFALALLGAAAQLLFPPWPARALKGVHPRLLPGTNDWGLRDDAHALTPSPDRARWIIVGDSFVEDGEAPALPRALQAEVGAGVEVVGLGVSATAPDEYAYRLEHVALALGPRRLFVIVYAGNDFVRARTLFTKLGVLAAAPRPSLAQALGLGALEHAWMNRHRPWTLALGDGSVFAAEEAFADAIAAADADEVRRLVVARAPEAARPAIEARLDAARTASVAALLQHPDAGLFRSYYLRYALDAFVHPEIAEDPLEPTVGFVRRAAAAARRAGVPLTIVIMPEAAQVDDRFVELWAPLAELRRYLAPKRRVAEAAAAAWRADGLDVLDLHPILATQRGAYLSLDGHLAAEGQHAVARAIAAHVASTAPR